MKLHIRKCEKNDIELVGAFYDRIVMWLDETRKAGFRALRVDIVPGNLPAKKLYEKNGFQYVGDTDLTIKSYKK